MFSIVTKGTIEIGEMAPQLRTLVVAEDPAPTW